MSTPPNQGRNPRGSAVENMVDRYLERGIDAGGTRSAMRPVLGDFVTFCQRNEIESVDELDSSDLREFAGELQDRYRDKEIAGSTANTYFNYVRAFLSFCVRDEKMNTNPANTERAEEFLPEDKPVKETQFWKRRQRKRLVSYATERVEMALEGKIDLPRRVAFRDRAAVVLIAELGVRGAEIFRDTKDDERNGLLWSNVDLERGRMNVYGKSRNWEPVGLTEGAHAALERLKQVQEPETDDWPVFPTEHAPSLYNVVEQELGERPEPGSGIESIMRENEISPPSITKQTGRDILKTLTKEARIDVEEGYLQPHGGRRGLGADLYEKGRPELAQTALRHKSIETTHDAYTDIKSEDVANSIDEVRD